MTNNNTEYNKAKQDYFNGNYSLAIKKLKKLAHKLNDSRIPYLTALAYLKTDDKNAAARYLHKVIKKNDLQFNTLQAHMLLGYIYASGEEFSKAEDHLHELLQNNYENAQIYAILGYIYNKRKDFSQAEYYYKKSLTLEPDNSNSHNGLGYNYLEWQKNFDEAFKHIQKAVEFDSENCAYLDSLGWFHYLKRSFSKALFYLTKAFRLGKHKTVKEHLQKVKQETK
ncbi:MAG TPA: tetratricopeptide repeat protein [Spirochaetota bacterium]|nr:tetratricopeptide repeat protein [Spirochaetota bacterium]